MSEKTVFISYRRDSLGKSFARSLKEALHVRGYDVFLDVDSMESGPWPDRIQTEVPRRAHFLLLLTPGALDRCSDAADWLRREFELAVSSGRNIVPVREESFDIAISSKSCHESMRPLFGLQIAELGLGTGFDADIETITRRFIAPHQAPSIPEPGLPPTTKVDISRIDKYAPSELIGREGELDFLSDAWDRAIRGETGRPHILVFVALGGEGKTSLAAKWVAGLAGREWPGCEAAFAWSFYSQGSRDQAGASSDTFLKEALDFFGDPVTATSAQGAYDKGKRLARLVGEKRALLILDGLEPLQYGPGSPTAGELKDAGILALLKGLAAASRGLCLLTTRYSLPDLRAYLQSTVREEKLLRLSTEAGVSLLRSLSVTGAQNEFETLVEDVKGHALSLNLLGSYLRDAHGGDIRRRDRVKLEEADAEEGAGHAFRVMDAYVRSFQNEGGKNGLTALAVLRLLGLFDRPASADCLAALRQEPVIPGLTDAITGMGEDKLNLVLSKLEKAKLLAAHRDAAGRLLFLDAHPLIREYFAQRLRNDMGEAWRAAHKRLYEHLCVTTKEGDRPSLEELQPLYQAVVHGCLAGMQQEACDKVYIPRIERGNEKYSTYKLGAFGADVSAVACFFGRPWNRVALSIKEDDQAWLYNEAAFRLRALGRLTEALEPMLVSGEMDVKKERWETAAISYSNLSELELSLGDLVGALEVARRSVTYANKSGDEFQMMANRATHAEALHQAGLRDEAEMLFREAETMQAKMQPDYPLLYSLRGFQYCDLLLPERAAWQRNLDSSFTPHPSALESCHTVARRAAKMFEWRTPGDSLLDIALDHLTLARSMLYISILKGSALDPCVAPIRQAMDGLRRAGTQDHLPRGLLTRAWFRALSGAFSGPDGAQADLDDAWEIAERGPMPLFQTDIHLYRARLFFREKDYPWGSPQVDLAEARRLMEKHGYLRRVEELEDAEAAL